MTKSVARINLSRPHLKRDIETLISYYTVAKSRNVSSLICGVIAYCEMYSFHIEYIECKKCFDQHGINSIAVYCIMLKVKAVLT